MNDEVKQLREEIEKLKQEVGSFKHLALEAHAMIYFLFKHQYTAINTFGTMLNLNDEVLQNAQEENAALISREYNKLESWADKRAAEISKKNQRENF